MRAIRVKNNETKTEGGGGEEESLSSESSCVGGAASLIGRSSGNFCGWSGLCYGLVFLLAQGDGTR